MTEQDFINCWKNMSEDKKMLIIRDVMGINTIGVLRGHANTRLSSFPKNFRDELIQEMIKQGEKCF